MSEEKIKMTGLFWLDKGTLGKDIRQGDEIPVGYIPDASIEKFKKEGKIGEKISTVNSNQEIVNLRKQVKDLSAQLKEAQKPQAPAGDESDKVKKLNEKLEAAELANDEISAENEAIKNAIAKLSEEYPELETKLQEIIEADTEDEGLIGKLGKMFSRK